MVVDYPNNAFWWSSAYGDLTNIIYPAGSIGILDVTLTADPGFEVVLNSFDLAGWPFTDYTINSVQVLSGSTSLFSQNNVFISGTTRTGFNTSNLGSLAASSLTLRINATNPGGSAENIGLDNIQFSQRSATPAPVGTPEPSALVALGAVAGFGVFIKRVRKDR